MPSSIQNSLAQFKNYKLRGEWVELRFMARAAEQGLTVSKPWGESAHYDFMVENLGRVKRIQVKSTSMKSGNLYHCNITATNSRPYLEQDLDFIVAYIIPVDVWYVVPIAAALNRFHLRVNPDSQKSKYRSYKEAWHLLL